MEPLVFAPTRISSVEANEPVSVLYCACRADLDAENDVRTVLMLVFKDVKDVSSVEDKEDTTVWVIFVDVEVIEDAYKFEDVFVTKDVILVMKSITLYFV